MNKQILSFSSGCVINLDDLDDFPDYFEVITKLLQSFKTDNINWKQIDKLLDADLQDVQHIPQFRQLLPLMINNYLPIISHSQCKFKKKLYIFLLKLAKNYFTSFAFEQQQIAPVLNILQKQLHNYSQLFCDFWLCISKYAPYVQKHRQLVRLYFLAVNQQQIFGHQQMSQFYIKSMDKILRFRLFRQQFQKIASQEDKQKQKQTSKDMDMKKNSTKFLDFKLSQYRNKNKANPQTVKKCFKQFEASLGADIKSQFVRKYVENWKQNL